MQLYNSNRPDLLATHTDFFPYIQFFPPQNLATYRFFSKTPKGFLYTDFFHQILISPILYTDFVLYHSGRSNQKAFTYGSVIMNVLIPLAVIRDVVVAGVPATTVVVGLMVGREPVVAGVGLLLHVVLHAVTASSPRVSAKRRK